MNHIAEIKDGSFYHISDIRKIKEAFLNSLGGLLSVVGYNAEMNVQLFKPLNSPDDFL